jgi:hypothetical protein
LITSLSRKERQNLAFFAFDEEERRSSTVEQPPEEERKRNVDYKRSSREGDIKKTNINPTKRRLTSEAKWQ